MRLAMIALVLVTVAQPANAARHCLNRNEAARTWPTRNLVKDADGCWTYEKRRREPPAPATADDGPARLQAPSQPSSAATVAPSDFKQWSDSFVAAVAAIPAKYEGRPMMDRWPEVREVTLPAPSVVEADAGPLVEKRDVAAAIALVLALVALMEVTFGGFTSGIARITRRKS